MIIFDFTKFDFDWKDNTAGVSEVEVLASQQQSELKQAPPIIDTLVALRTCYDGLQNIGWIANFEVTSSVFLLIP